jgi:hypothetical protein
MRNQHKNNRKSHHMAVASKNQEIKHDNENLVGKIHAQATRQGVNEETGFGFRIQHMKSLNYNIRRGEQDKIRDENAFIARRIIAQRPVLKRGELDRHAAHYNRLKTSLRKIKLYDVIDERSFTSRSEPPTQLLTTFNDPTVAGTRHMPARPQSARKTTSGPFLPPLEQPSQEETREEEAGEEEASEEVAGEEAGQEEVEREEMALQEDVLGQDMAPEEQEPEEVMQENVMQEDPIGNGVSEAAAEAPEQAKMMEEEGAMDAAEDEVAMEATEDQAVNDDEAEAKQVDEEEKEGEVSQVMPAAEREGEDAANDRDAADELVN